jgi:shikimate kinase
MSKIFLIGFIGVGKTTVGRVLADSLNYGFIDMDDNKYWTKLGYSAGSAARDEMYESNREKFWDIETDILKDLCMNNHENLVIATGGSTVLREENVSLMKSTGIVIFLNANIKTIHDRLKNSDNLFHPKHYSEKEIKEFRKGREPKYKFADLEIDTSDKSIEENCFNIELYVRLYNNNIGIKVLKENNVFLVGSSILRLFMNIPLDTDLDFYIEMEENYKRVDKYFNNNFHFNYDWTMKDGNFKSYKCNSNEVQLMNRLQSVDEFIGNFDFTIIKSYFSFKDEKFVFHKRFFDDIKNKRLVYESDSYIGPLGSIRRADKYKKLGFKVDNKSFKKLYDIVKSTDEGDYLDKLKGVVKKVSWLRDEEIYPSIPNIDFFVNWLMEIKEHKYFDKFNYYLFGGFISWPEKTKDIDILITKRNGQHTTLKELEELMVDMFDFAYDTHGFFLDTCYMRTPQWIADYPRSEEILRSIEQKGLWITITKNRPEYSIKFRRYGKLNCCYRPSFTNWWDNDSDMINRWVNLDANYARMVDLRKIIKYYENNKERNMKDFLNEFQEYSGY